MIKKQSLIRKGISHLPRHRLARAHAAANEVCFALALRRALLENEIDLVVDVGANVGQFGLLLRSIGYHGAIRSFEPNPSAFNSLAARVARDPAWQAQQLAAGNEGGELPFNVYETSEFSSFLDASAAGSDICPQLRSPEVIRVPVQRLDSIASLRAEAQQSNGMLLKTDTQGFDLAVLRGAEGLMGACRAIVVELSVIPIYVDMPDMVSMLEYLDARNFRPWALVPTNTPRSGPVLEYDGLFTKDDAGSDVGFPERRASRPPV